MQTTHRILACIVALGLASMTDVAGGATGMIGDLRGGGTARGDISTTSGDADTIFVDLQKGSRVSVKWRPSFHATLGVVGPDGSSVDLGLDGPRPSDAKGWSVPATGRYEFRIASSDTSQGTYALTVLPYWDKRIVLTGTGDTVFDVPMPASSYVKGKVQAQPGAAAPRIGSFASPSGAELLVHPVGAGAAIAKLPSTLCPDAGEYRFTASAVQGTGEFSATLTRRTPRAPRESVNISNGLEPVSFEASGLADYFAKQCSQCHDWAKTYAGSRNYARESYGRMRSGSMPKSGPRAGSADLSLLQTWIKTGYGK